MENKNTSDVTSTPTKPSLKDRLKAFNKNYGSTIVYGGLLGLAWGVGIFTESKRNSKRLDIIEQDISLNWFEENTDGTFTKLGDADLSTELSEPTPED